MSTSTATKPSTPAQPGDLTDAVRAAIGDGSPLPAARRARLEQKIAGWRALLAETENALETERASAATTAARSLLGDAKAKPSNGAMVAKLEADVAGTKAILEAAMRVLAELRNEERLGIIGVLREQAAAIVRESRRRFVEGAAFMLAAAWMIESKCRDQGSTIGHAIESLQFLRGHIFARSIPELTAAASNLVWQAAEINIDDNASLNSEHPDPMHIRVHTIYRRLGLPGNGNNPLAQMDSPEEISAIQARAHQILVALGHEAPAGDRT